MKRKLLLIAVVIICCATLGFGSVAYFTASAKAVNVITSGNIKIAIVERQLDADGELVAYPDEPVAVMPGAEVSKIVTIRNEAEYEAWVRAKVAIAVLDADGEPLAVPDVLITLGGTDAAWKEKDGFYYYTKPLAGKAETESLLETVAFDAEAMDNAYQGCTVTVSVSAQALQVKNIPLGSDGLPAPELYPAAE